MVAVRIYVEGGGDDNNTKARLREGFVKYFGKLLGTGDKPKVILCGGRDTAFDQWQTAMKSHQDAFCVLLVDSEAPVARGNGPWVHLKRNGKWDKPAAATNDHCHLMVQCTEAWFIADGQALKQYYGQGFNESALPRRADIEAIPKAELLKALALATRNTKTKGAYGKGTHAADLLAAIDPGKVTAASPHMATLAAVLKGKLGAPAAEGTPAPVEPVARTPAVACRTDLSLPPSPPGKPKPKRGRSRS